MEKRERRLEDMLLNLTKEQKNSVRVTYSSNRFVVNIGKQDPILREYYSVDNMRKEFYENGIEKADFDDRAFFMYEEGDEFSVIHDSDETLH
ncbi:MAG: cytoplasmic protein [Syntrophus sp. (in: bacteria)]|jgi:hypothetical protein|nr:cytoplasmic protein [Syntrophus sp. (in: bacteria)]